MRWFRAISLPVLMLTLVACGSPAASDAGDDGGPTSQGAVTTPPPAATDDPGTGGGGGGGDLDGFAADLTPPNATETSRTTIEGALLLTWNSSDSPASLEGFYEDVISRNGLEVVSRTTASGSYSWIFGANDSASFTGLVTVAPSGQGDGSTVAVQVNGE